MEKISFISTHFYDFDWTQKLIHQLNQLTPAKLIFEILIINQDRNKNSRLQLKKLDKKIRVVEYPISEKHFLVQGHDHAFVLNQVILEAKGDYLIIFDSDAHPFKKNWLPICENILSDYEAILAEDPINPYLSHPCFMLFPRNFINYNLEFDKDLFTGKMDTGRLIGEQLQKQNRKIFYAKQKPAFNGHWGSIYLESIYHHGNGSFLGGDNRLLIQVRKSCKYFKKYVIKMNKYELTFIEEIEFLILSKLNRLFKGFFNT